MGEDHRELIAAETGNEVNLPQLSLHSTSQVEQDLVSHPVTVAVVHLMEVVQIEHGEDEGVAEAVRALTLVRQAVLKHPVACDAGEGVDRGRVDQLGCLGRPFSPQRQSEPEDGRRGSQEYRLGGDEGGAVKTGAHGEENRCRRE